MSYFLFGSVNPATASRPEGFEVVVGTNVPSVVTEMLREMGFHDSGMHALLTKRPYEDTSDLLVSPHQLSTTELEENLRLLQSWLMLLHESPPLFLTEGYDETFVDLRTPPAELAASLLGLLCAKGDWPSLKIVLST